MFLEISGEGNCPVAPPGCGPWAPITCRKFNTVTHNIRKSGFAWTSWVR